MTSLVQILKVNEPRTGVGKTGKAWLMQEAEVALLDDAGVIQQVGGLLLPRDMTGDKVPSPGVYMASFSLEANYKTRQVEAVVTSLTPYPVAKAPASKAEAPAPAAKV